MKRGRRQPRARMSDETLAAVRARQRGRCACGCGGRIAPFPIGYHHVLPKARWPELTDDPRDIVGVTADCHANHETRARTLSRAAVIVAEEITQTPQMQSYLERTYGPIESPQAAGSLRAGALARA